MNTHSPLVIEKPSQKLLEFVRGLECRKSEKQNELLSPKDKCFPTGTDMNEYAYQVDLSGLCKTPCPHFKQVKVGSTACYRCACFEHELSYSKIPEVGAEGTIVCDFSRVNQDKT